MLKAITIKDNEKFLRQVSKPVDFNDKELQQNFNDIKEFCILNDKVYAMACIQLGIPKRIVYIKSTDPNTAKNDNENEHILMINPQIISKKGRTEHWEVCASGLDNFCLVERPYEIVVKYQNEKGECLTKKFEGFASTVISHELDHLDGIFHMDRAKIKLKMPMEKRIEFRKKHTYRILSKDCEFHYKSEEEKCL